MGGGMTWAVIGCDHRGVTVEKTGDDADALCDAVASWAQQEEDKWPTLGLVYMLVPSSEVPEERCPHGTVETDSVRCRDCNRERLP